MTPSSEKTAIMHSAGPNACDKVALYLKPNVDLVENDRIRAEYFEDVNGEDILPNDQLQCGGCGSYLGRLGIGKASSGKKVEFYG